MMDLVTPSFRAHWEFAVASRQHALCKRWTSMRNTEGGLVLAAQLKKKKSMHFKTKENEVKGKRTKIISICLKMFGKFKGSFTLSKDHLHYLRLYSDFFFFAGR